MKKIVCILISIMIVIACIGCQKTVSPNAPQDEPASESVPTPEPTPEPVFKIAVLTDNDDKYFKNAVETAVGGSEELVFLDGTIDESVNQAIDEEASVVIAYIKQEGTSLNALKSLVDKGIKVLLFDMGANNAPDGVNVFGYDTATAQDSIFNTLMTLPNHDTPVRLFGMFSSETTDAATAYLNGINEGKVFDKGIYVEDINEETPEEWIAAKLKKYYPGMLDAVYAENERYAEIVLDTLNSLERTDIEVVTLYSSIPEEKMLSNPYIYTAEVCPNTYYIGTYLTDIALKSKSDDFTTETFDFTPEVIYGEYLKEEGLVITPLIAPEQ